MIIGITGASGAGKSIASEIFNENGFYVIDLDKTAHGIYETSKKCVDEVAEAFGKNILDADGKIVRKRLGEIVFADKEKLNILNKITHKYILEEVYAEMDGRENVILDAPLLFETGLNKKCDITLGILSADSLKSARIEKRDSVSEIYAKNRLARQNGDGFFEKNCTFCIRNDGSIDEFKDKIRLFIKNEVNKK